MQQQSFDAIFENRVFRPLADFQLTEGQTVKLIIESESIKKTKGFPKTGIIAQLTANPIMIPNFHPLTREEANERW
ncbi:MAG: antitoxin family protein [Planktothrix sp.]|uniref:antitoxin family protein n=1 Tax=Planktothrix sp. TaxID=3088171 RepID=UPI0038D44F1E